MGPKFGIVAIAGVEGTSSYGAGLTRVLQAAQIEVAEVSRPDRAARRRQGKSDPLDAYAAARAALAGPLRIGRCGWDCSTRTAAAGRARWIVNDSSRSRWRRHRRSTVSRKPEACLTLRDN